MTVPRRVPAGEAAAPTAPATEGVRPISVSSAPAGMTVDEALTVLREHPLAYLDHVQRKAHNEAVETLAREIERLRSYCESQDWHTEWYVPMKRERDAAVAERDRLREAMAALRGEVGRYFVTLRETLEHEITEEWETPANRTNREYTARQALVALKELEYRLAEYREALSAVPAPQEKRS